MPKSHRTYPPEFRQRLIELRGERRQRVLPAARGTPELEDDVAARRVTQLAQPLDELRNGSARS